MAIHERFSWETCVILLVIREHLCLVPLFHCVAHTILTSAVFGSSTHNRFAFEWRAILFSDAFFWHLQLCRFIAIQMSTAVGAVVVVIVVVVAAAEFVTFYLFMNKKKSFRFRLIRHTFFSFITHPLFSMRSATLESHSGICISNVCCNKMTRNHNS